MTYYKPILIFIGLLSFGCDGVGVTDDLRAFSIDLDFDGNRENQLSNAYAEGTDIGIHIRGGDPGAGWTVESSDSNVISFQSYDVTGHTATLHAEGEGTAQMRLLDPDGDCEEEFEMTVVRVARATLAPNGTIEASTTGMAESVDEVQVLVGGSATLRVRYFDENGVEALGRDLLEVMPMDVATPAMTTFTSFNAWLSVEPTEAGESNFAVVVDGRNVGQLRVNSVAASDLTGLQVLGGESGKRLGEEVVLHAVGLVDDVQVLGVGPTWSFESMNTQSGDLLRYSFDPDSEQIATVRLEVGDATTLEVQHVIHTRGTPKVTDSANIGCSVGANTKATVSFWLLMGLLLSFRLRRPSA